MKTEILPECHLGVWEITEDFDTLNGMVNLASVEKTKLNSFKNSNRVSRQGSVGRGFDNNSLPSISKMNNKGSSRSPQKGFNYGSDPYSLSVQGMQGLTATTKIEHTDA